MRHFSVIIFILIVLQSTHSQTFPSFEGKIGQIVTSDTSTRNILVEREPFCPPGKIIECTGCHTKTYCLRHRWRTLCPRETPYCVNTLEGAECRPNPESSKCPNPFEKDVQCSSEGFYPNPYDCHSYFYCNSYTSSTIDNQTYTNLEKIKFTCPDATYVYDETIEDCKKISLEKIQCPIFECFPNKTTACENVAKIEPHRKYFAFCYVNPYCIGFKMIMYKPTILYKCGSNEEFTGSGCKFICPFEGRFAFGEYNTSNYYECYKVSNTKLTYRIASCPNGLVFNNTNKRCSK